MRFSTRLRISSISALALVFMAPLAPSASADDTVPTPSVLLVQQAPQATMVTNGSGEVEITMVGKLGKRSTLTAFEERPGRRVLEVTAQAAVDLWETTFERSAPNAVLTGTTTRGNNSQTIVELTSARFVPTGITYTGKVLSGPQNRQLTSASLVIDGVSVSAVNFPTTQVVAGAPDLTVTSSAPYTVNTPTVQNFSTVTLETGGSLNLATSSGSLLAASITGVTSGTCGAIPGISGATTVAVSPQDPAQGCAFQWSSPTVLTNTGTTPIVFTTVSLEAN